MTGMFEVVASTMDAEQERLEGNRARIAATKRLEKRFLKYLSKAESEGEMKARLGLIEKPARAIVKSACEEHRYDNSETLYSEILSSLVKRAVETGDTYTQETVDTPKASPDESFASGLDREPSPKTDKKDVPSGGLSAVDVPSAAHPSETQSVADTPEYGDRHDGPENPDPTKSPREQVDADAAMQPELHAAPNTDTWSDKGTQAEPVTSSVEAQWSVLD